MALYKFRYLVISMIAVMLVLLPLLGRAPVVHATAPSGMPMVTINGGGGANAAGSDGIKITFNIAGYGEQLSFAGNDFIYSGGDVGETLNIGGTPYTVMNGSSASATMSSVAKFDSLVIGNLTGSANTSGATTTGSGSVVMTYTKTIGGKAYILQRTISYTYPNYYYHDEYDVTIPAGNTATVKLYKGGDTAPGGSDSAYNMYITNPVKNVQSIEPNSRVVLGMKEIPADTGMSTFEGAYADNYTNPYATINSGGDIGFHANYGPNDAGFMIQYTIGSTPGTYHEENITYVGFQKVNLEASWSSAVVNDVGRLNLMLTNAFLVTKTGLGFNFQLPAGLIPGALGSTCTGSTVTVDGSNVVHVSGISMTSLSSCLVTVDVGSPSATTYTYTSASASSLATVDMANAVGSSPVTFLQASSTFTPTPTATSTATLTPTATSTPTKTSTSTPTATSTPTPTPSGQTITFPTIPDKIAGAPTFTVAATTSSSLAVTYASTTPAVCTVSGAVVTIVGPGTCSITASQPGGTVGGVTYSPAANVTNSFTVKANQTITFATPADKNKTDADFSPGATATSGLPVVYTSSTPSTCTIVSNQVHLVAQGTCTVTAAQAGDNTYAAATSVTKSFLVKEVQTISFPTIPDKPADAAPFSVVATVPSGLIVTYTSTTPAVCTIANGVVTVIGPGDCSIKASQPGGTINGVNYAAAPDVINTFKIKAAQVITFSALNDVLYTTADFDPGAIASSTLPVTYTTSTPSVCTIVANQVHLVTTGTCTVTANQIGGVSGSLTYNAAPPVTQSFASLGVQQSITFPAIPNRSVYEGSFVLNATASSGLPVNYISNSPAFCTIAGTRVTIVKGGGFCTIVARQGGGTIGGSTFGPAPDVTQEFVISNATRTPTASNTRTATPTAALSDLRKAAIGNLFVVALLRDGTIAAWGSNKPNIHESVIPPQFQNTLFKDVAASIGNAYVLDEAGNLYTWGENLYGEGDIPGDAQNGIKAVAAGARFAFAIRSDDTVAAWGRNEFGQVNVPAGLSDVIAVDGGDRHAVALKRDGTVVAWGDNTAGQTNVPPGLSGVIAISAGQDHTMALLNTGTVVAWGGNSKGQTKVPLDVSDIVAIAAGRECSFAVKADGTLYAWGNSTYTKFPAAINGRSIVAVDSANQNSIVGLRGGGILVAGVNLANVMASRTLTTTPIITLTPSETSTPSETPTLTVSKTPSMTRSLTFTRTYTFTRTITFTRTTTFTRTPSFTKTVTRTMTPSRTKSPTRTP
mgnify:CR=1 FL=1